MLCWVFNERDGNLSRRYEPATAHRMVAAAQQDGGEDQQPAEDDHKDAPNRSHRSTYTAFDPSHACGLLTGHPGPSMPAKPLTDHFPPADSRSGTADRQSVVEGKRVSVRVELGGRRLIQKTKPNEKTTHK